MGFSAEIHPGDPIVAHDERLQDGWIRRTDVGHPGIFLYDVNGFLIGGFEGFKNCNPPNHLDAGCTDRGAVPVYHEPGVGMENIDSEFVVNPEFGESMFEEFEDLIPTFNQSITESDPPETFSWMLSVAKRWTLWAGEDEMSGGSPAAVARIKFNDDMTVESFEQGSWNAKTSRGSELIKWGLRYRKNLITTISTIDDIIASDDPAQAFVEAVEDSRIRFDVA